MTKFILNSIIFLFFFCIIAPNLLFAESRNYLNEINTYKWHTKTLKVWVQDSEYRTTAYKAINEWHIAANGCINFKEANNEKSANIRIYFVDRLPGAVRGRTTISKPSNIEIATIKYGYKSSRISKNEAYAVILHEMGHALGIIGHSSNNNDIMYATTNIIGRHTSNRDFNTIRAMYCK